MQTLVEKLKLTKIAARILAKTSTEQKNIALNNIITALESNKAEILAANALDLAAGREAGLSSALLDRLSLSDQRIAMMIAGLEEIIALPDPIGEVLGMTKQENGLLIGQTRVPLGVVGIIYEARPNVTVDGAALCLKAGNGVVLRGGSEAINSNLALVKAIKAGLKVAGLPLDSVSIIEDTSRVTVTKLMKMHEYVDVLIPRGGPGLIAAAMENATIPVIQTGAGNCHIYVDSNCDLKMAESIIINAKVSRPGVCNAVETVLVHQDVAAEFLPQAVMKLKENQVEIRGCQRSLALVEDITPATADDWSTEFLDFVLAIKVVDSLEMAIEHINYYGTMHSEAIVTNNYSHSQTFLAEVDAAAVYVNASTRFTDGSQFGLGAEIGISTQKIHARGPMGLKTLTSTKYIVYGNGQIRQ